MEEMADMTKTVFGDMKVPAIEVVRVQTESSTYFVAFHTEGARRYVVVRGAHGSDRENVVIRDSDPRIGEQSMFDVPVAEWVGKVMEVATMRTSAIVSARREGDAIPTPLSEKFKLAAPAGMSESPRIQIGLGHGTNVANPQPAPLRQPPARDAVPGRELARNVVIGQGEGMPYPMRHVRHAEDAVALLRSVHRRVRIFDDLAHDRELRGRLEKALDEAARLLAEIRRRG
jgi:hypothetical protein